MSEQDLGGSERMRLSAVDLPRATLEKHVFTNRR